MRDLHGSRLELSDAFVHGRFDLGDMPVSFRAGRFAFISGESLFFPGNGIAGAQAPVDEIKQIGEPQAEAPEIVLPVAQVSLVAMPFSNLSITLYDQLEWRADRDPGTGSYFSDVDFVYAGGERFLLPGGGFLRRTADQRPPPNGQFGIALNVTDADVSYGAYAMRFAAKSPQVYFHPDAGAYNLVYPQDIELYGASFSTYAGDSNIAGEISARRNMPLVAGALVVPAGAFADGGSHALYPAGDSLHAQLSLIGIAPAGAFWQRADLGIEVAANYRLDVTRNLAMLAPGRDAFAMGLQASFEPQYFEVLPGLDLSVPIGFGYGIAGRSSVDPAMNVSAGNFEIGLAATYRAVWQAKLVATEFIGAPSVQPFADRGFLSFSIQRTF